MRRGPPALLVASLLLASIGVVVADRRLPEAKVASGDGLAVTFSGEGAVVGVRDRGRDLPLSGARGGFAVRVAGGGPNFLHNGGFEDDDGGTPDGWTVTEGSGEAAVDGDARSGDRSWRVSLPSRGTSSTLAASVPVEPGTEYTVRAWIRTEAIRPTGTSTSVNPARVEVVQEGVEGRAGTAFAFGYTDDSPWTRHEAGFRTAPGVERVSVRVVVRGGSGTAWFDDVSVSRLLDPDAGEVRSASTTPHGVRLEGRVADGLSLRTTVRARPDHLAVAGVLEGTDDADHAAQVAFTLPVDATGWRWGDDVRRERAVADDDTEYANLSDPTPQGGSDPFAGISQIQRTSIYPFGGIARGETALGVGVPMTEPRAFRIEASPEGLAVTFDLGVSPDAGMGPRADFHFVLYRAEGEWGFRALAARYYALYPASFERRTDPGREGAWFFAPPLDSLPGTAHRDFGLGLNTVALGKAPTQSFSEWGTAYVPWSRARGIYTSAYTHQWAFFLPSGGGPIPYADLTGVLRATANRPGFSLPVTPESRRLAREADAAETSTARDVNGRYLYETYRGFHSLYQNHDAASPGGLDWGDTVRDEQIRRAIRLGGGRLEGIHMDSTSGARRWGAVNDFDRGHWARATIPLTFSYGNGEPAQLGALSMYRQIAEVSDLVRRRGMILSANFNSGTDRALGWLGADRIDFFGVEQGLPDKAVLPERIDPLALLKRTLAYHRPVTTLDTAIADGSLTLAEIEGRIEQSLFYGIFPGAWVREENEDAQTVATWSTPEKRRVFARYVPAFRALAEGGWEPVTLARSSNPNVWVERYGTGNGGPAYLTLRNETDSVQRFHLTLDAELRYLRAVDLLSGRVLPLHDRALGGRLGPGRTLVVALLEPAP